MSFLDLLRPRVSQGPLAAASLWRGEGGAAGLLGVWGPLLGGEVLGEGGGEGGDRLGPRHK